ncbi:flagellar basal-body rod protein FlgG [Syntrophothermus lipocalidus]|uniref:Flagellar basal-body rod protein FlgG n=1 Tax=Syntrophothermus lipocalidus (strain DSM 12680 / TGB-C1) TaxID=643648 RepID=D7CLC1_SYNLT|nr:flagellar basal-body rod protein FlgG [Syntrophothermus lipocalidus]ADI01506.1 flagellar basal-body rod protein FlgG [Syntrophothermus lipocalidus DSM 12680]
MLRALYTSSTGMFAQQLNIDNIAHNIANVNTTGYKKSRVEFQDLIYQMLRRPVANDTTVQPSGLWVGLGVKPSATQTIFSQGNLTPTDNPLDVAIQGQAFFRVQSPTNEEYLYTRDGSFKLDSEGNLVTTDGYYVVGVDTIDPEGYDVTIAPDGTVTYKMPGQDEPVEAGQVELAKFTNPAGLEKIGGNLYRPTASSGEAIDWDPEADTTVSLHAGYLEAANIQIVEEMVNLITAQRAYEINSKVIQSADEMLGMAANLRR